MINTAKPTTSIVNTIKVSFAETWATILTSWQNETRSWLATGSLFSNSTRVTSAMTNIPKP